MIILFKSFHMVSRWEVFINTFRSSYNITSAISNRIVTPIISRFTTTYCKHGTSHKNNNVSHIINFRQNYINFTQILKKAVNG